MARTKYEGVTLSNDATNKDINADKAAVLREMATSGTAAFGDAAAANEYASEYRSSAPGPNASPTELAAIEQQRSSVLDPMAAANLSQAQNQADYMERLGASSASHLQDVKHAGKLARLSSRERIAAMKIAAEERAAALRSSSSSSYGGGVLPMGTSDADDAASQATPMFDYIPWDEDAAEATADYVSDYLNMMGATNNTNDGMSKLDIAGSRINMPADEVEYAQGQLGFDQIEGQYKLELRNDQVARRNEELRQNNDQRYNENIPPPRTWREISGQIDQLVSAGQAEGSISSNRPAVRNAIQLLTAAYQPMFTSNLHELYTGQSNWQASIPGKRSGSALTAGSPALGRQAVERSYLRLYPGTERSVMGLSPLPRSRWATEEEDRNRAEINSLISDSTDEPGGILGAINSLGRGLVSISSSVIDDTARGIEPEGALGRDLVSIPSSSKALLQRLNRFVND
tara:strand:- start:908 stop:2287 length:1380 start_codon:yes stop_codon:yes gene_type:complete